MNAPTLNQHKKSARQYNLRTVLPTYIFTYLQMITMCRHKHDPVNHTATLYNN